MAASPLGKPDRHHPFLSWRVAQTFRRYAPENRSASLSRKREHPQNCGVRCQQGSLTMYGVGAKPGGRSSPGAGRKRPFPDRPDRREGRGATASTTKCPASRRRGRSVFPGKGSHVSAALARGARGVSPGKKLPGGFQRKPFERAGLPKGKKTGLSAAELTSAGPGLSGSRSQMVASRVGSTLAA